VKRGSERATVQSAGSKSTAKGQLERKRGLLHGSREKVTHGPSPKKGKVETSTPIPIESKKKKVSETRPDYVLILTGRFEERERLE